jgi:carbamoyltransferase
MAYAIQKRSEDQVLNFIKMHVPTIHGRNITLAGGVFANVRINQKVKELGFSNIFIQPAMDDGGLSVGVALSRVREMGIVPVRQKTAFLGPGFEEAEMEEALKAARVSYSRVDNMAYALADLLVEGKVIARYDGRMEFGPRALGNRSILYHTRDPSVNTWLNTRLGRTEFMPFAPATLSEEADRCYLGLDGARHAAEFMTITFDCTEFMKEKSPAVVHVDGTARAQIVTPESNPGFHEIISEYYKKSGIPSLVNTSFNMHESPIVCTPQDAVTSFLEGRLDYLALGPFLVKAC